MAWFLVPRVSAVVTHQPGLHTCVLDRVILTASETPGYAWLHVHKYEAGMSRARTVDEAQRLVLILLVRQIDDFVDLVGIVHFVARRRNNIEICAVGFMAQYPGLGTPEGLTRVQRARSLGKLGTAREVRNAGQQERSVLSIIFGVL